MQTKLPPQARTGPSRFLAQPWARSVIERLPAADSMARRVAVNSGWLIAERVVRLVVSFVVSILVIRYLGPTDYGVLAYGLSMIAIVDTVTSLGLRSSVVRELVDRPQDRAEILGTTVALRLGGSLAVLGLLALLWAREPGSDSLAVLTVLALGLPLMSLAQLDMFFQATLESHYAAAARTIGLAVSAVLRIGLLLAGAPLLAFAAAAAIEFAATGLAFAALYARRREALSALRVSRGMTRHLVNVSWPLFMSALAAAVYFKIDQVMLQWLRGSTEVGIYAAAARLSDMWYFVPVAIATSMLPMFVQRYRQGADVYRSGVENAYRAAVWIAIPIALGVSLLAGQVTLLFGSDFSRTGDILRVHVWAAPFIFMSAILGRAMITEERRRFELSRNVAGALLNVALNLVLIPPLGGMGAAIATLVSYAFTAYFICWAYPPARQHALLMTRAVAKPWPPRSHANVEERAA